MTDEKSFHGMTEDEVVAEVTRRCEATVGAVYENDRGGIHKERQTAQDRLDGVEPDWYWHTKLSSGGVTDNFSGTGIGFFSLAAAAEAFMREFGALRDRCCPLLKHQNAVLTWRRRPTIKKALTLWGGQIVDDNGDFTANADMCGRIYTISARLSITDWRPVDARLVGADDKAEEVAHRADDGPHYPLRPGAMERALIGCGNPLGNRNDIHKAAVDIPDALRRAFGKDGHTDTLSLSECGMSFEVKPPEDGSNFCPARVCEEGKPVRWVNSRGEEVGNPLYGPYTWRLDGGKIVWDAKTEAQAISSESETGTREAVRSRRCPIEWST